MMPPIENASYMADEWARYGGECTWTMAAREFGALGGLAQYWCGMPRSSSAIPLTFALFTPGGERMECNYRLKDIRAAIAVLRRQEA